MKKVFEKEYFLVPGEADAQCELPVMQLVQRLIEVASLHANELGIGHTVMEPMCLGWVLSRLSVQMRRFPAINRWYSVSTWIESWTRHYSERCFEIKDESGEVLGYARTVWMVLDTQSRQGATTEALGGEGLEAERDCPMERMRRLPVINAEDEGVERWTYRYGYTDLDFYRHVNTVKHIRTLIDTYPLEVMDRCRIVRADFAFMHEGHYNEEVTILRRGDIMRVVNADGTPLIAGRLILGPR